MSASRLPWLERAVPARLLQWEGATVCLATWAFLAAIPLALGGIGLSTDALNHHIYLGWTAQEHRLDRDFLGGGYQSFQWPYLYWPVYRMAVAGWSGMAAGLVLATAQAIVAWPVWMLARACIPGATVFDLAMRILAVALALASGVVLSVFGSTMNDLFAAVPLVWAVALAIEAASPRSEDGAARAARRAVLWSGLAAGVSVALKLSNGPLAACMPLLWLHCARGTGARLRMAAGGSLAAAAGFTLVYGYWGSLLWRHYGNPIFPFQEHWFAPLRAWLGGAS